MGWLSSMLRRDRALHRGLDEIWAPGSQKTWTFPEKPMLTGPDGTTAAIAEREGFPRIAAPDLRGDRGAGCASTGRPLSASQDSKTT